MQCGRRRTGGVNATPTSSTSRTGLNKPVYASLLTAWPRAPRFAVCDRVSNAAPPCSPLCNVGRTVTRTRLLYSHRALNIDIVTGVMLPHEQNNADFVRTVDGNIWQAERETRTLAFSAALRTWVFFVPNDTANIVTLYILGCALFLQWQSACAADDAGAAATSCPTQWGGHGDLATPSQAAVVSRLQPRISSVQTLTTDS